MLKMNFEEATHMVTEKIVTERTLTCDVCGKEIPHMEYYWELFTYHNDWGNNSCERNFDICSKGCMDKKYEEYMQSSGSGENTECFEVMRRINLFAEGNKAWEM
jgi:hypothetical protein